MFEITQPTIATLVSITPRSEKHGDDEVPAVSYGLKITGANTLLDLIDKDLRSAIYHSARNKTIDGVDPIAPTLRCKAIEHLSVAAGPFEAWTLNVDHGIDEGSPISFGGCKVDKFKVTPVEGGSVEVSLRVGTSDIGPESAGLMSMKIGQQISITLLGPKVDGAKPTDGKPTLKTDPARPLPKKDGVTPEQALAESLAPLKA